MDKALSLPRQLALPWRWLGLAAYVVINLGLIAFTTRLGPWRDDWQLFLALRESLDNPYQVDSVTRLVWSPLAAPVLAGVTFLGYWGWAAVHVAALALLRDWRIIALVLVSWAFWQDVQQAMPMTFVFVAAWWAMKGSKAGIWASLILFQLMPRPLVMPLMAWILWRHPETRVPFVAMSAIHAAVVIGLGLLGPWVDQVRVHDPDYNLGPTLVLGSWWYLAGVPLAIWLTKRGHVGWAGLALSIYVIPQYLLMPLVGRSR